MLNIETLQLNKLQTSNAIEKSNWNQGFALCTLGPSMPMLFTAFTLLILITKLPLNLLAK